MQNSKFTESQTVSAIKKQESGVLVKDISRELGINQATFINGRPSAAVWKSAM